MSREALKTLFYPFETETLSAPEKGTRVLFLGAEPGFRFPEGFDATVSMVQGFRPSFVGLQSAGHDVKPRAEGESYDCALVLCGRHRGQNELRVAEALERVSVGGLIVVAGSKDDGIASLKKRVASLIEIEDQLPKYHGVAFWFRRPADDTAIPALKEGNGDAIVEGGYLTKPGMFSHDKIDTASRMLVESLPLDVKGAVADFCSGWGYLAKEAATRWSRINTLDLYEADYEAVEASRQNLENIKTPAPNFHWFDLISEKPAKKYDVILMNPPFHQGRAAEPDIGQAMIGAASAALKPGGRLFMVANRRLPYERVLAGVFSSHAEIAGNGAFKVFAAKK